MHRAARRVGQDVHAVKLSLNNGKTRSDSALLVVDGEAFTAEWLGGP